MQSILLAKSRGPALEAEHIGALAVVDAGGRAICCVGDVRRPFYPRSGVKLFHTLPFLASGARDGFSCSAQEVVLAAASHAGEEAAVQALEGWLGRLGLGEEALACGPAEPLSSRVLADLRQTGRSPRTLHNNNAGKHLAVLSTCLHLGEEPERYCAPGHPAQRRLAAAVDALCDWRSDLDDPAVDNCGMAAFPLPAFHLALGMARLGSLCDAEQLLKAIRAHPEHLAGSQRLVTRIIRATGGAVLVKGGSEGVMCATAPAHGIGLAIKLNDGSGPAASAVLVEVLARLGLIDQTVAEALRSDGGTPAQGRAPRTTYPALDAAGLAPLRPAAPSPEDARAVAGAARPLLETAFRHGVIAHHGLPGPMLRALVRLAERAMDDACAYLGREPRANVRILIVGRRTPSVTSLDKGCVRVSRFRLPDEAALLHEYTHLLAGESPVLDGVLTEGLAVHVQSLLAGPRDRSFPTAGADLHTAAARAMAGRLPSPLRMTGNRPGDRQERPEEERRTEYLRCGSFVRFLIGRFGLPAFMDAYRALPGTFTAEPGALASLEGEWRRFIEDGAGRLVA